MAAKKPDMSAGSTPFAQASALSADQMAAVSEQYANSVRQAAAINKQVSQLFLQYCTDYTSRLQSACADLATTARDMGDVRNVSGIAQRQEMFARALMRHSVSCQQLGLDLVSEASRLVHDALDQKSDRD